MNDTVKHALRQAEKSCMKSSEGAEVVPNGMKFCEKVFDGILCWPRTPAGDLANQSCSSDFIKAAGKGFATKQCEENGQWHVLLENSTQSWTNYTQCGRFFIVEKIIPPPEVFYQKWIPVIKDISHFGYILSIISLAIALLIFIKIKRLHCSRNTLHIHLFLSFEMRAFMSLLKDGIFVKGTALSYDTVFVDGEPTFAKENYSWGCKAMVSLQHYFIISNYMFLLMEGTYLHNLMFLNLFSESGVTLYCALGWGLPMLFVIPWVVLKAMQEDSLCWTQKNSTLIALLIDVPIGLSVIINFVLFVIIVRVLFVKLTSMYIQQRRLKYRKLLRSTLTLVPIFGIPYTISLILSFHITKNQTLEVMWLFFDQTFTAFQGVFASLGYCHLNSEVQTELKRKYVSFKDRNKKEFRRSRTISHTQQISLPLTDDLHELSPAPPPPAPNGCLAAEAKKTSDLF